ncbi:DGQHR domain-containing protein [Candidatus Parcubacteria bacterium]|nr:MAG: DGQHR domain-containing protein [Candidatus Parcubacteria bacterium]
MSNFKYECFYYKQRDANLAPAFCIFCAPVGEILEWSAIKRLNEQDDPGPQRRTSRAKVLAITRYLDKEERNTIPTSIILTLDLPKNAIQDVFLKNGEMPAKLKLLTFKTEDTGQKPGLIIDGQHRLLGVANFDPNINVNVVALINADDTEKAFQFLVINNKASKVSSDHIRGLALEYKENELAERLKVARLTLHPNVGLVGLVDTEDISPFRGIVKLPIDNSAGRIVVPASIETSLSYIQQQKLKQFESEDVLMDFYYGIWGTIKEKWGDIWNNQSKLLSKVGVVCMTEYMTDALVASYDLGILDIADPDGVKNSVQNLLETQRKEFWSTEWTSTSYDTRAGREIIKDSLIQVARNVRSNNQWYDDIDIIDISNL